jgi:hypothetical protein
MQVAEQRSNAFCSVPNQLLDNKIIRKDIERVLDGLGKIRVKKAGGKYAPPDNLPRRVKAAIMRRMGDLDEAAHYLKLETSENKDEPLCAYDYATVLVELGKKDTLQEFIPSSAIDGENKTYFLLFVSNDGVIKQANEVLAKEPHSLTARINRAIAYKRLKRLPEMEKDLKAIEERKPGEHLRAGIAALRKDKEEMLKMLSLALDKGLLSTKNVKIFPVFEDYHNDEDFKSLVQGREKEVGK